MNYLTDQSGEQAKLWMLEAAKIAEKAMCHRAKCGTVIVANGTIIGAGYNAPALDKEENRMCDAEVAPGKPNYDRTCCVHAEWRAILDALAKYPDKIKGAKLYFTRIDDSGAILKSGKPFCTVCSRLALDTGIATFVLWHEEGICEYPTVEYNRLSYAYIHTT